MIFLFLGGLLHYNKIRLFKELTLKLAEGTDGKTSRGVQRGKQHEESSPSVNHYRSDEHLVQSVRSLKLVVYY